MASPLPTLIKDISLTLTVAGAVVVLAQWLGVPLVVAYLFSGMIVGPSFSFFPTVVEIDQVRVLSELGILFLLFGLGLEFSFRKLFRLGIGVLVIGAIEVLGAVLLGYYIGSLLGLEAVQRVVFGFIVAISSTGVIVKLLQEKKLLKLGFAQAIVGILIVEDLFAIIFLLLLAVLKEPSFAAISAEIGLLFSLSTVWLVGGTIILPIIVKKITPYLTDEVLVVSSLGFCLGVVLLAADVGVSSALAAFLCGSVLAETDLQHRIEEITRSIRQFFTAIFFVSMGMLVDPKLIIANWSYVLIVVVSVIIIKFVLLTFASILTGRAIADSARIGILMSQIGEFSIIIASLAVVKGFLPPNIEGVVVGASAVLILLTGLLSKFELPIAEKFESIIPKKLQSLIVRYRYSLSHFERNTSFDKAEQKRRRIKLVQNAIIVAAIFFVTKFIMISAVTNPIHELIAFMLVTFVSAPFLYSMSGISRINTYYNKISTNGKFARRVSVEQITRLLLTIIFYMLVAFIVLPDLYTLLFVAIVGMILSFLFSQQLHKANTWVFKRLANEDKALELEDALPRGGPWDENLVAITVHPFAMVVDKTLAEIDLRNQWGVNVIFHQRAERRLVAPPADTKLYPADVLLLMGSSEKLDQVERIFSSESCLERTEDLQQAFVIKQVRVEPDSAWDNKLLADLDLQNSLRAVIVAIERSESEQIRAPQANTLIKAGDLLWLAMDKSRVDLLGLFTSTLVSDQDLDSNETKA
jgi:CPA2 family monovalent cation:H+ antiporter-2